MCGESTKKKKKKKKKKPSPPKNTHTHKRTNKQKQKNNKQKTKQNKITKQYKTFVNLPPSHAGLHEFAHQYIKIINITSIQHWKQPK